MKKELEFYNRDEIKNLLLNNEKLVYADDGYDEVVVRYSDLPDFIVDMSCNLKVYKYPSESMTPILTTIGEFLDKCEPDVRKDIIDRLVAVQTEEDTKSYKLINKNDLEIVREEISKNLTVKIQDIWLSDYGDIRCCASLFFEGREKANIIASFDREEYLDWKNSQEEYKKEIKENWENYLNLPKISECSKLLQEIYDNVCESETTMCHITNDDWKEFYAENYTNKDIETLKEEVKNYKLDDVITFDDAEYKIIGWGNLETSFNDDRNIKTRELDNAIVLDVGHRGNEPIALVERKVKDYSNEYVVAFGYKIANNKIDWAYGSYYDNDLKKATQDFDKVLSGGNLADTFNQDKKDKEKDDAR